MPLAMEPDLFRFDDHPGLERKQIRPFALQAGMIVKAKQIRFHCQRHLLRS